MAGFFADPAGVQEPLAEFLRWFYPDRPPADYNLEDVLAFLDISRHRLQLWGVDRPEITRFPKGDLYASLLAYVKKRLSIPKDSSCDLHTFLVRTLGDQDSIITVNYDVIVERSLRIVEKQGNARPDGSETRLTKVQGLIGTVPRFMQPTPGLFDVETAGGFLLKLHGSLDWLYCPTPGCSNNVNIYATEVSGQLSQTEGIPCRFCGTALQTFIVPPIATKRLEDRGRMAFLWNLALRELASASRLVVVGLSLAPSDFELRWLIRQAFLLRSGEPLSVTVVNPCADHRERFYGVLPVGHRRGVSFSTIAEYRDSLQP
jgi:hypothetical protein